MTINFESISLSKRTPGIDTEANLSGGGLRLATKKQRLMLVGQRMSAKVSTPSFISGTLNDCTLGSNNAFTGSVFRKFVVEITTAGGTDVFRWSNDNGATWTPGINCATGNITLSEGVTITFSATTGHALGDKWTFFGFPAGSVAQLTPTAFQSLAEIQSGCGSGSILYRMAKAMFATADNYGIVDSSFTSMDDAAGTAATGSITVVGTASAAGYLRLRIGNEKFEVGFSSGDTAAAIALALKGELDKAAENLPVMFNRATGTLAQIIFTAKNLGALGNDIKMATEYTANTGITTTNVAMASGATDPSNFAGALDAFQASRYHIIASALSDASNLAVLSTHLDAISNPNTQLFATGYFGQNGATLATVTALASGVNQKRMLCAYLRGSLSAGYEITGAFAALKCYIEDPNLPLNEFELFGLNIPAVTSRYTAAETETLLWNGVSPLCVDNQERVAIVRAITTDITHASMLDIGTIVAWDYFRFAYIARCKEVFKRAKNTPRTPAAVVTQGLFVARQLALPGVDILRDVEVNKSGFTAEPDPDDPTAIRATVPSPIVPGLQRIMARFDLIM